MGLTKLSPTLQRKNRMSHRTGDIIADVIATHTYEPDSPLHLAECSCGAHPLDGFPQHVSRMIQHALATRSVGHLSDTKLRILGGKCDTKELTHLAVQGVDAFDLLHAIVAEDIETMDRAACNATVQEGHTP